jgi:hypothetical protein
LRGSNPEPPMTGVGHSRHFEREGMTASPQ